VNAMQDRPSGTWQVTGPGQRTVAYVAGRTCPEACEAVRHRPDLRDITRLGQNHPDGEQGGPCPGSPGIRS
jgi:hypothetical protein